MEENRTSNSIKNIKFALTGQVIGILISLLSRLAFVRILSEEYLGLSSLFSNILSILSLAEMGFGTAISYALYEPIANKNISKIKKLMKFYKKIYITVGIIMIILGIVTIPIYPYLINEIPDIPNLNIIYFLFVLNTASSYFFSHKRILLISDQKKYIDTIYKYGFFFILNIIQIIILYLTKDFILYLIVQVLLTNIENIFISKKINKIYPYLKEKNKDKISEDDKKDILNNVKAMFFHKFGGAVLNATDNIVTSKILSLTIVGLYSNYYLITSALDKVITQMFSALVASIGNLNTTATSNKKTEIFKKIFFANFWIYIICCSCLLNLLNPFISLWLGEKYLLSNLTIIVLVINIYIYGMRRTAMTFREATGNYRKDWYSPIIEATINIISSILLAKKLGISGVFFGTIISSLCTNFWLEPKVVCDKTLDIKLGDYFKQYFKYTIVVLISCITSYFICNIINDTTILNFILKLFISMLIPNIIVIIIYRKNSNFKYYINLIKNKVIKKKGVTK